MTTATKGERPRIPALASWRSWFQAALHTTAHKSPSAYVRSLWQAAPWTW